VTAAAMVMVEDNMLHAKPTQFCQRYQKELINYLCVGRDPLGWVGSELTFHPLLKRMQTMENAFPVPCFAKTKCCVQSLLNSVKGTKRNS
jgi:hypothetical protein